MNMTLKEMKNIRLIANLFIAFAGILLIVSLFSNMFDMNGVIFIHTDDVGEPVGYPYIETLKVYSFAIPSRDQLNSLYYQWEMTVLYLVLFVAFVLNFINFKKYDSIKQYIISVFLILLAACLIMLITIYKKEQDSIAEEFVSKYLTGSKLDVTSGIIPFLAYALTIIAGFFSLFKAWLITPLSKLQNKSNVRNKK